MAQSQTWKEAVRGIVQRLPREFSLADVLAYHGELQRRFPNNRFIDAKSGRVFKCFAIKGCYVSFDRGIMNEKIFHRSSARSWTFR